MKKGPSPAASGVVSTHNAAKPRRYRHTFWWYLKLMLTGLSLLVFCLIVVTIAVGKGIYDRLSQIVPDVNFITQRNKAEATQVWSAPGSGGKRVLLAEFKAQSREWVPIDSLRVKSTYKGKPVTIHRLIDATLAIEDVRFYHHPGMDAKRIAGAAFANFTKRDATAQGGSTITEQLARNIYFKRRKNASQRLQAALLALQLERRFTKDEILELYLNEIYYGNGADGCEAAAQTYFGKRARDLSISEAAFLAGLPNSPSYLDPFEHFERAQRRQRIVLREMFENKKINYQQWTQARADTSIRQRIAEQREKFIAEKRRNKKWRSPYFVSYVKQYLQKHHKWDEEYLSRAGLKIYTTLDPDLQGYAEDAVERQLARLGQSTLQAALVCVDPWTGHVVAMVGGRDYYNTKLNGQFNRATQAKRQPGSSFKPYLYAAAMEAGYTPDSIEIDKPIKVYGKEIRNYDRRYRGAMTLRKAIGDSNNVVAVKTMLKLGGYVESAAQVVIQKAHLMGIESNLVPVPTLALGASEVTPLEHTSAFGVFATRGLRAEETPIERVLNANGETIIEHSHPVHGARVLSEPAANSMWQMLRYVVESGTGGNADIPGVDVIGKTGTTSSNKDVWFIGATKRLSCAVWMGYDRPKELYGSAGGRWCAPVWRSFMVRAMETWRERNPVEKMIEDSVATNRQRLRASQFKKYVQRRICDESGLLAIAGCSRSHMEMFSSGGGVPTDYCNIPSHQPRVRRQAALNDGVPSIMGSDLQTQPENFSDQPARREAPAVQPPQFQDGQDTVTPDSVARDQSQYRGNEQAQDAPPDSYTPPDDGGFQPTETETGNSEVSVTVCADTGLVANSRCPVTAHQFFEASQAPRKRCNQH
jgi:penicillin-binding protein 1A